MTRAVFTALITALILPISSGAFATDTAASPAVAPSRATDLNHASKRAKTESPDDVVCKSVEIPGSRIGSERACMTRGEWAQQGATARDALMGSHPGDGMPK